MSGYSVSLVKRKLVNLRHAATSGHHGDQTTSSEHNNKEIFKTFSFLLNHLRGLPPSDADDVIAEVVNFFPCVDLPIKKLLYHLVSLYSQLEPQLLLHASNAIRNDRANANPMIRRATCTIKWSQLGDLDHEHEMALLLRDKNARVRTSAIQSMLAMLTSSSARALLLQAIEQEPEAEVVVCALLCLVTSDVEDAEVYKMMSHLMSKLQMIPKSHAIVMLLHCANKRMKVNEMDHEKRIGLMNAVDAYRRQRYDVGLLVETYKLMVNLSRDLPAASVHNMVMKQFMSSIVDLYKTFPQQIKVLSLTCLTNIARVHPQLLISSLKSDLPCFCPHYSDIKRLKVKKLEFLKLCIDASTASVIFSYIVLYLTQSESPDVVKAAFKVLKALHPYLEKQCWSTASALVHSEHVVVMEEAVMSLALIFAAHHQQLQLLHSIMSRLIQIWPKLRHSASKDATIWLISHNTDPTNCDVIRDIMVKEESSCDDSDTLTSRLNLLVCCTRSFLEFPKTFSCLLKELLMKKHENDGCSANIKKIYSSLIKSDQLSLLRDLLNSHYLPCEKERPSSSSCTDFSSLNNVATTLSFLSS